MPVRTINGNELYYELHGNTAATETIVFLNGVMTSTASWAIYFPLFEKLGFQILLHDFKGQMQSAKPPGPYTFSEHANDLNELLNDLNIPRVHLVGTSYGSEVGLRFALDYPENVISLTIIDGASEIDETSRLFVESWKHLAEAQNGEAFFWGAVPSLYYNQFVEKNKDFLAERAVLLNEIDPSYFKGQLALYETYIKDVNMTRELTNIHCPSLIVVGENDLLTPRKFADILAEEITNSEYMIVPKCGHVTIFEQPEILKSALLGFVLKNSEVK